jgi:hypothetical protein
LTKASGNLGVHVLNEFFISPYEVSILTRKESTSTFPEGVPIFRADYSDQNQLESAMKGHQIVVCMVAIFATGGQQILVDAAIAAGVEMFFPSEFGPPSRDEKFAALHPALPPKIANVIVGEADQYGKRIRISACLLRFRSTTCYNYTMALAFGCVLLDTFLFLLLDFGNYSFRRSPLFRLSF